MPKVCSCYLYSILHISECDLIFRLVNLRNHVLRRKSVAEMMNKHPAMLSDYIEYILELATI
jgi:hypothetical protein